MVNRIKVGVKWLRTGQKLQPEMVEVAVLNQQIEIALESNKDKYNEN